MILLQFILFVGAWKHPININQESYDKVQQVGQGPNLIRKYKKPRLDGPLLNKDPHLLGLDEPIVVSNPDPPPPDKQPRILFSGINPRKHAKVLILFFICNCGNLKTSTSSVSGFFAIL